MHTLHHWQKNKLKMDYWQKYKMENYETSRRKYKRIYKLRFGDELLHIMPKAWSMTGKKMINWNLLKFKTFALWGKNKTIRRIKTLNRLGGNNAKIHKW